MYNKMKAPRRPTESSTLEEVLHDVRSSLRGRKQNAAEVGSIIALYGSIMSLCAKARRLQAILKANSEPQADATVRLDGLKPAEVREFSGFFEELLEFGVYLNEVSMATIDIFYPGLKDDLMTVVGGDINFSRYYHDVIVPTYGLTEDKLPLPLFNILDRFNGDSGPRNTGGHLMKEFSARGSSDRLGLGEDDIFYRHRDTPTAIFVENFMDVSAGLERCRETIAQIVRDHWDFRDLTTASTSVSVNIEGDLDMSETQYSINKSQVGAVGSDAHVHDIQFRQTLERAANTIDSSRLAEELAQLKAELAKLASDRDHYAALVAVSDAAVDAKAGDGVGALSKLAAAGKWAFDVATKIGVSVAADAIKVAIGLK